MRVVIDTNVLLVAVSPKSKMHPIFQAILNGKVQLCISNSILEEYEEILSRYWSPMVAQNVIMALIKSPFIVKIDPRFRWTSIFEDPDDDKFVDCAVASAAEYLVTNDKHFDILKQRNSFPPINIINEIDFLNTISKI